MSLLIKNGNCIDENEKEIYDIYIEDEKIIEKGKNINKKADRIIDAKGNYLLPGGVDVHTHMELDLDKYVSVDDFYTGTVAAAYGGTTSIVDHIGFGPRGCSLKSMIDHYHDLAETKAVIDYSFHGVIQDVTDKHLAELDDLFKNGIVSLKMYTTYGGMLEDDKLLRVLKAAKKTGTVVCVHCENDGAIKELRQEAIDKGNLDPIYHAKTRPNSTEAEAVNRLIYLSEIAEYPKLYIVHTSTKEALEEIKNARLRGAKNIYCETCTQYLILDESKYVEGGNEEGIKYIMAPPLRSEEDKEALWQGIKDGDVDVIATDHCPFFYKRDKLPHKDNFINCPGGAPGVEERMELILTEGIKRGITIEKLVEILIVNPAKIFGMYPKKASLEEGSDADIVIYKKDSYQISQENRHSNVDYTSYEGFTSDFKVDTVISRGQVIVEKGKLFAERGQGKFIKRVLKKEED
ncbi:MAG: dihydropyrimidinase [Peptoniphilaceae bacterium]